MKADIYRNRRIGILGLGRSGVSACELAVMAGAKVFATELNPRTDGALERLKALGVGLELGRHTDTICESDLVVVSPGIEPENRLVRKIRSLGIPLLSELEFAWNLIPSSFFIAVTGTNGKSTTCGLIGDILLAAGKDVLVGGNIGIPLSALVPKAGPSTFLVSEVSTFQLENTVKFRPWIAVLTNITEDHFDRHHDRLSYVALKKRIFENQTDQDSAVINLLDPVSVDISAEIRAKKYFFADYPVPRGAFIRDGKIFFKNGDEGEVLRMDSIPLQAVTTVENVLAAVAVSAIVGVDASSVQKGVREFKGLSHRLEEVIVRNGIKWINNSMCTNPVAARTAILSLAQPVVLIAGGKDKGLDAEPLIDTIVETVKFTVLMGEVRKGLGESLVRKGYRDFFIVDTMEQAVRTAHSQARSGEFVLLSPGYSSQDMYTDFEERGRKFKEAVLNLYGLNDEN
jgi:UDP-N-acetylmuramoylalanine--D-glutamate ligase